MDSGQLSAFLTPVTVKQVRQFLRIDTGTFIGNRQTGLMASAMLTS